MYNVAIIGSRTFVDYTYLKEVILKYVDKNEISLIVSGGAKGADTLAEKFAKEFSIPIKIFYPDWDKFGKSAGYRRNIDIVQNSDIVFAFQHNNSKGTQHSIELARQMDKIRYIIKL